MIVMNTEQEMSTDFQKLAEKPLEACELEIRKLVGMAAQSGNYDAVNKLTELAQNLGHLKKSLDSSNLMRAERQTERVADSEKATIKPSQRNKSTKRRRTGRRPGYPKFEVEGNSLVKISWSKTKKSEYVHKAPKRVLECLIKTMLELGADREVVSTERMFPLVEGDNQYPDYQSYLCLLWLKQNKMVIHHGREGYQVADPDSLQTNCERLWAEMFAA